MIERPLDFLNNMKGERILIEMKDGKRLTGKLLAFDIHVNLVIDSEDRNLEGKKSGETFIRGEMVKTVC